MNRQGDRESILRGLLHCDKKLPHGILTLGNHATPDVLNENGLTLFHLLECAQSRRFPYVHVTAWRTERVLVDILLNDFLSTLALNLDAFSCSHDALQ